MTKAEQGVDSTANDASPPEFVKYFFFTYAGALLFMTFFYVSKFGLTISSEHGRWGEFGDFVGGILNPLTSFFTLLVAILVWSLQKKELAATRLALRQQVQTSELQRYESTLFKLLEYSHNSLKSFSVRKAATDIFNPRLVGLEAIDELISQFEIKQHFEEQLSPESIKSMMTSCDALGFYEPYAAIRYAYIYSLQNCPVDSKSAEYATMTHMLMGHKTMILCRYWAIAVSDSSFIDALPKEERVKVAPC